MCSGQQRLQSWVCCSLFRAAETTKLGLLEFVDGSRDYKAGFAVVCSGQQRLQSWVCCSLFMAAETTKLGLL